MQIYNKSTSKTGLQEDLQKKIYHDPISNRYFYSTPLKILNALYMLNRDLAMKNVAFLNDFYSALGLEPQNEYELYGWDIECMMDGGIFWIDVNSTQHWHDEIGPYTSLVFDGRYTTTVYLD